MRLTGFLLVSVMTIAAASGAQAQQQGQPSGEASPPQGESLKKLLDFKSSGSSMQFETVPQTGAAADNIRENLKRIKLPPGFKIDLYAVVPDARHMAVGPHGQHALRRHAQDARLGGDRPQQRRRRRRGEAVRALRSTSRSRTACASRRTAFLFVVEQNRVLDFPAAEFFYERPGRRGGRGRAAGQADPGRGGVASTTARARLPRSGRTTSSTSRSASRSTCRRSDKLDALQPVGHRRHHPHGPGRQRTARSTPRGVRNSVGMDFNPKDKTLWFTDNQVDGMGDDIPPGETQPRHRGRAVLRLPVVRRRQGRAPSDYKDSDAAGGRRVPAGRDWRRTRPTSA